MFIITERALEEGEGTDSCPRAAGLRREPGSVAQWLCCPVSFTSKTRLPTPLCSKRTPEPLQRRTVQRAEGRRGSARGRGRRAAGAGGLSPSPQTPTGGHLALPPRGVTPRACPRIAESLLRFAGTHFTHWDVLHK